MVSIQTLLKALAFCVLNASLLPRAQADIVLVLPEDPACTSTPDLVYAGIMAITDPACLDSSEDPGCNLFGIPDCRACALVPEAVTSDSPPCKLLVVFNQDALQGEQPANSRNCNDCEPEVPLPLVPGSSVDSVKSVETADANESSGQEDYVPIVIVLPIEVFIETESSVLVDSESSSDYDDDSDAGDESNVGRRLRAQL
ncbi:uncharacterized protein IUM83_10684 [Phytophthora cinnamomi]|uniref:uncharacterized protein n=1 Tax=Phytophthora cinnamomi TaxID=4785 RepID=UPI00355A73F8|nr:hypothetical protein IUM83_12467 [Phytophthora cinnamomi]KAG6612448.1 hypothetical protein IUM83_10684 [Phytophthora cinnamomi]